jgi:putative endonuclease
MPYFTYILFSQKLQKYYVGSTNNLIKRLERHNLGHTTFTKTGIPWVLVFYEKFDSRPDAYNWVNIK